MSDCHAVVEAIGLRKEYKDFWGRVKAIGVDGIDFSVGQGQVFGLLGPNGSGKTTTIKLILGLLRPLAGSIKVFNGNPADIAVKKRIGYLPEDTYLYQYLNAEETLSFFGSLFRLPASKLRGRTKELLDMVGLTHVATRKVGEFSKGMARRIGLAQALINDPDLIILDEPTSGLDPIGCREVKNLIKTLSQRNKTIIICSHLLADIEDVCDTILIIYGGRIQTQGTLKELLTMEDEIQITLPSTNSFIIDEVKKICNRLLAQDDFTISHPTAKLEQLFARVIKQARSAKVKTAGVGSEGQIAPYLAGKPESNKSSEQVLQEWNANHALQMQEAVELNPEQDKPPRLEPDLERLQGLTGAEQTVIERARSQRRLD